MDFFSVYAVWKNSAVEVLSSYLWCSHNIQYLIQFSWIIYHYSSMKLFRFYVPWSGHDGWKIVLQKHVIYRVMWSSFSWRHFIVHSCFYLSILSSIRFFFIRQKSLLHVIKHLKKKKQFTENKATFLFIPSRAHTKKKHWPLYSTVQRCWMHFYFH